MRPTLDRVASNEEVFAAANDQIAFAAGGLSPRPFVPFLCECPVADCSEIAELELGEYAALRLFADRFLVSCRCRSGENAGSILLERNARYSVVERVPAA